MSQLRVITWQPRKHLRYWIYTLLFRLPLKKKWKSYWFVKRCNLINKPFLDALIKVKPLSEDQRKQWTSEWLKIRDTDFTWEVITNKQNNEQQLD